MRFILFIFCFALFIALIAFILTTFFGWWFRLNNERKEKWIMDKEIETSKKISEMYGNKK